MIAIACCRALGAFRHQDTRHHQGQTFPEKLCPKVRILLKNIARQLQLKGLHQVLHVDQISVPLAILQSVDKGIFKLSMNPIVSLVGNGCVCM